MAKRRRFPMPRSLEERWVLRVETEGHDGCWMWVGARWKLDYGKFCLPGDQKRVPAHRWGYEHFVEQIPPGLQLDHLCRNHWCVNPDHLEPVTPKENVRRGVAAEVQRALRAAVTHCPQGHEYNEANTYYAARGSRNCRICGAQVAQRRREKAHERRQPEASRSAA